MACAQEMLLGWQTCSHSNCPPAALLLLLLPNLQSQPQPALLLPLQQPAQPPGWYCQQHHSLPLASLMPAFPMLLLLFSSSRPSTQLPPKPDPAAATAAAAA
jgi:hypothetical protein